MKRIFVLLLAGFTVATTHAQDLDDIKDMINKNQFKEAKAGIDKYLSNAKNANDATAWYYKGRIYNSLSREKATPETEVYGLKNEAFEALKKNQQLDPKDVSLTLEDHASYLDLYAGLYDFGASLFNSKNFEGAYMAFKKALEVKDYTLNKKYTFSQLTLYPLDTTLVLNTAVAASQAKKTDEAIAYYRQLTDANVGGKDYENIYEYLVDHYSKKGDKTNMQALLAKAKKMYPENPFWTSIELKEIADSKDTAALYAKYDEMLAKNPGNFELAYNYAAEMYNSLIKKDPKDPAAVALSDRLTGVLKIAMDADKGIDATVLMANHLFNISADLLADANLVKGNKPDDVKKKADLKGKANAKMDETIVYAEKALKYFEALPTMKPVQKANYKIMLDHLSEIYGAKNNPKKVAEYEAKNKAVDKL